LRKKEEIIIKNALISWEHVKSVGVLTLKKVEKNIPTSIIKRRFKYNNSERGYFIGMFNNIKQNHKRKKQKNEFKNYEEFYQCWLDQQKIYGRLCPYTKRNDYD
jgi:hypothetical protein